MNKQQIVEVRKKLKHSLMENLFTMIINCTTATELRVVLREIPKFKEDGMIDDNDVKFIQQYVVDTATNKGLIK